MKTVYTSKNFKLEIEFKTQKELFEELAAFQDVFEENTCGNCTSENTYFSVREVDGNKYYERKCRDCGCALTYGQNKTGGTLFPKRKKADGSWDSEHQGWKRFEREDADEAPPKKGRK